MRTSKARLQAQLLSAFLLIVGLQFLLTTAFYLSLPSEAKNAVLFGFSPLKMLVILALGVPGTACIIAGIFVIERNSSKGTLPNLPEWIFNRWSTLAFLIGGLVIGAIAGIPPAYFGTYQYFFLTAKPAFLVLALIGLETAFVITQYPRVDPTSLKAFWEKQKTRIGLFSLTGLIFLLLWAYILLTGRGISSEGEPLWYEAGVPVLWLQIIGALLIGMLFWGGARKYANRLQKLNRLDFVLFLLIWLLAGAIWASAPIVNGYWNPASAGPTDQPFPFSDARRNDVKSQFALIGEGLNNGSSYNRPAYPAFLVLVHLITGQDFEASARFQAALYGVLPALVSLLGIQISNRPVAIGSAALITLRGLNGIYAAGTINLVNQQQMMPEFGLAIILAAALNITLIWLQRPRQIVLPLLLGGLMGLTLYLRPTSLGILIIIPLVVAFAHLDRKRSLFLGFTVYLLGVLLFLAPWEVRNAREGGFIGVPETIKKIVSVVETRYREIPAETVTPPRSRNDSEDQPPSAGGRPVAPDTSPDSSDRTKVEQPQFYPTQPTTENLDYYFGFIQNHFLHNLTTSLLVFPDTFTFFGLDDTIKRDNSFWKTSWDGEFTAGQLTMITINGLLICAGLTMATKKTKMAGLTPLAFFLSYHLTNAFGRTSGGRHLVPVDWILIPYYVFGLFVVVATLLRALGFIHPTFLERRSPSLTEGGANSSWKKFFSMAGGVLLAGYLIVAPDLLPGTSTLVDPSEDRKQIYSTFSLEPYRDYFEELIRRRNGQIVSGHLLYPEYFPAGSIEFPQTFDYNPPSFEHTAFSLISSRGEFNVVIRGKPPANLEHGSDVIVIGCKEGDYIVAYAILIEAPGRPSIIGEPLPNEGCKILEESAP